MGVHDGYLDRMAARIEAFERELRAVGEGPMDSGRRRDLEAGLATIKERLQVLRRSSADLTEEMTQSFTQSFERLRAAFGEWRGRAA
jgi:predicted  nucleic acid-binding Zn-ribbon protein